MAAHLMTATAYYKLHRARARRVQTDHKRGEGHMLNVRQAQSSWRARTPLAIAAAVLLAVGAAQARDRRPHSLRQPKVGHESAQESGRGNHGPGWHETYRPGRQQFRNGPQAAGPLQ